MKVSFDDMSCPFCQITPGRLLAIALIIAASLFAVTVWISAQAADAFELTTLSARPDMVSGGDVLVSVTVPQGIPLDQARVTLNGADITSAFHRKPDDRADDRTGQRAEGRPQYHLCCTSTTEQMAALD